MEAAIAWGVPLVACILVTAAATFLGMHPLLAAFCAPPATALFIALAFSWTRTDAFWALGVLIISVCALPLTIVTAIVTDNLMDKYDLRRQGPARRGRMHDLIDTARPVVIVLFWVACMACPVCAHAIRKHLRVHHPDAWRTLGFLPGDTSFFVAVKDEKRMAEATTKLRTFLRHGEHERLKDPRLNALVLRQRGVIKVACMLMIVVIVGMLLRL